MNINSQMGQQSFRGLINLNPKYKSDLNNVINFNNIKGTECSGGFYYLNYINPNGELRNIELSSEYDEAKDKLNTLVQANAESDLTGKVVDVFV